MVARVDVVAPDFFSGSDLHERLSAFAPHSTPADDGAGTTVTVRTVEVGLLLRVVSEWAKSWKLSEVRLHVEGRAYRLCPHAPDGERLGWHEPEEIGW